MKIKNTVKTFTTFALVFFSISTYADQQYNLRVDGITCPFCVATSAKALRKIDGVDKVSADIKKGTISVCTNDDTTLDDELLTQLFLDKGFNYRGKVKLEECEIE